MNAAMTRRYPMALALITAGSLLAAAPLAVGRRLVVGQARMALGQTRMAVGPSERSAAADAWRPAAAGQRAGTDTRSPAAGP